MADTWYVQAGPERLGPMSLASLREMYASGKLGPADYVFTEGWSEWRAAADVAELGGSGPAVGAAGVGQLQYRGAPTGSVLASEGAIQALVRTRPWLMLWAVILFLGAALCALGAVAMVIVGALSGSSSDSDMELGFMLGLGLVYLLMGAIYLIAGLYLTRFFMAIGATNRLRRPEDLERAMTIQLKFWRITGIALLTVIVVYLLILAGAVVFGIMA